jgi:glycosyltransferase involved in cell wall biosynthesis
MPDLETGAVTYGFYNSNISVILYRTLWNVGVADAFNFGVSLSTSDLVFMLGSDDKLHPDCLELCVESYEQNNLDAWYNCNHRELRGEI